MKKLAVFLILSVLGQLSAQAQTVTGDRLRLNSGPCIVTSGSGSPEASLTGSICDVYINTVDGVIWSKWTGSATNTGWKVGFNTNARTNGNFDVTGYVGQPGFVSQTTGWRIDDQGAADLRYLYTDQLHAKAFIADLEQALAGSQIIAKSVTILSTAFTNPATGGTATLHVKDLPSAPGMAVFESGDTIRLRSFSRASGSLTIADSYGVVTSHVDVGDGTQTWTYTRNSSTNGGTLSTSAVIAVDAIVVDYGTTGNGFIEANAIDGLYGVNSPYTQVVTWATSPISANLTVRVRSGNLKGITGSTEFGILAGTYAATGGQYFKASNLGFELQGIDLSLWDGSTKTFFINHSTPSLALGSAVPSSYSSGTGIWMGKDSGAYKLRVGNPSGNRLTWDGSTLTVVGDGGGVTNIAGSNIQTGTITATQIAASTITGTQIAANTIAAGNIVGGTITANELAANSVIASKISVSTLDAISANLGTVTAGTINGITINGTTFSGGTIARSMHPLSSSAR